MASAVEIDNLSHSYPAQRRGGSERQALAGLSVSVNRGEIFGLLGPNGGGKTTLFRILSTSLAPLGEGRAAVFGHDVVRESATVRGLIGVVFQNPSLDGKLTVLENLRAHASLYGLSASEAAPRIDAALAKLGLSNRRDDFVEKLSGGLQRRGEIAKSLIHKPELLLMDEPSTGLDPGARRDLWDALRQLKESGMTIMLTTHLMEEGERCDRVAIVNLGRVVAAGAPSELKKRIGGDVVWIQTAEAADLAAKLRARFHVDATALDDRIRIEIQDGHKFIPQLVEAFPGSIEAVSVGKPTLEDVFVHETGRRFSKEGGS
ncbi:MAG: ATP-binding cassette domain-containing protein [Elusimicrobia bacterium]|nr:ATP-binding cassette domain-containing protein [Elusimicrobiota bacterium]